jgi:hypothetical protein
MDLASWMAVLAVAILAIAFIARPFIEKDGFAVTEKGKASSTLLAERDRIITVLQELELDYAMGKVSQEDYQIQRENWVRQGASIMKQLDELGVGVTVASTNGSVLKELDAEVEAAIARRRESLEKDIETDPSKFCGHCGSELQRGDRFCSHCGAAVLAEIEG